MICGECDSKNSKNANYCSNCGKKLIIEKNDVSLKNIFKNIISNMKGMFLKPIDTTKKFIQEENYMMSLIYLSINILVMGLFILILLNSSFNSYNDYINYGYTYNNFNIPIELSYFRLFLIVIMTGVVAYASFTGIAYLITHYLFKGKTSFNKILSWLSINSLFATISLILIAISYIISVKLGLLIFLISAILYIYNLYNSIEYTTDTDKNKLGYILMATILITLLIITVVLPKIFY